MTNYVFNEKLKVHNKIKCSK